MADAKTFNARSAKRIARVVREYEREPGSRTGEEGRQDALRQPETIWALISSQGTDPDDFKYAWEERRPLLDGTWEAPTDPRSGTVSERPAINANPDTPVTVIDKIVLLRRCQYEDGGEWKLAWGIVGAGGSIDAKHADVTVATAPAFLNIGTGKATDQILEMSAQTLAGIDGARLTFKDPGTDFYVLQRNGGNIVWDEVRAT